MRSALFVPGDSDRKLEKGLDSQADCLFIDLEDSVSPQNKAVARETTLKFLNPSIEPRRQRFSCGSMPSTRR